MKKYNVASWATVLFFCCLLGGIALVNLLTPAREFSENENTYLQTFPAFSWDRLKSGKFTADFDKYVTDQFVARDSWISVKTLSELSLRKRSNNGVYFAADEYLIEMFDEVDTLQYERNLEHVAQFSQRIRDGLGFEPSVMLVPTASMVLQDKLPAHAPEIDQRQLLDQAHAALPGFVDVSGPLGGHSDEYIYYRTDHHWTSLGAWYAYVAWCEREGIQPPVPEQFDREVLSDRFYGTTYSKASLYTARPDTITAFSPLNAGSIQVNYNNGEAFSDSIYERSYLDVKDKYSTFLNANQPITQIKTSVTNGKKLLLIKDSYANTFAQMAVGDFEEITLIDLRYFKLSPYDYAADNGITDILILYNTKGFAADTNLYYLTT